jgi:hypothetical protein
MSEWGDNAGDRTPYDIFQIFVSLTKIQGRHSLKTGVDIRESRESSVSFGNSGGQYIFREDYVRGPLDNSTAAPLGQDLASLMLGYPTGGSFSINASRTQQAKYWATFHPGRFPATLQPDHQSWIALRRAISAPPNGSTARSPASMATSPARSRRRPKPAYARNPINGGWPQASSK